MLLFPDFSLPTRLLATVFRACNIVRKIETRCTSVSLEMPWLQNSTTELITRRPALLPRIPTHQRLVVARVNPFMYSGSFILNY